MMRNGTITFKVNEAATDDDLKALIPTFNISDKATVSPVSGVAQDFSSNKSCNLYSDCGRWDNKNL